MGEKKLLFKTDLFFPLRQSSKNTSEGMCKAEERDGKKR